MTQQHNTTLIKSLQNKALYDHPVSQFEVFETHISWVLLTGPFAYKIKKPVNFGFLDFSTLEKRHYYCDEEVRLNMRLAPQLYIGTVCITGSIEKPSLAGDGPAIEYAVKMRQFNQTDQFDRLLSKNLLDETHIDQVAEKIADFHCTTGIADAARHFGTADAVKQPVEENFSQITPLLSDARDIKKLQKIQRWSDNAHRTIKEVFEARKVNGFIRECHGDMHMANITLYHNNVVIFDCLEFNDNLRWIDVISEIAFMMMDLDGHGCHHFAYRFLNAYLQHTGDYDGLKVLRYYLVYRAMVRAKVACLRQTQPGLQQNEKDAAQQQFHNYMDLAEHYTRQAPVALMITHGLSGSGKTTITQLLLQQCGAIRIRSDIERKRLHGLSENQKSESGIASDLYDAKASEMTYQHLSHLAATVIEAGYSVIVDAAFLKYEQRNMFQTLAGKIDVPYIILDFQAPEELLRKWIIERVEQGHDASEADIPVLEYQLTSQEPLTEDEYTYSLIIDTSQVLDIIGIVKVLDELINHY